MKKLIYILFIIPYFALANMAKPWVDGSEHSILYGSKNCDVLEEYINVKLLKNQEGILYANYRIKYIINSNIDQTLPLLFIGIGLNHEENVTVNGVKSKLLPFNSKNDSLVKFTKTDSIRVDKNHLIYFKATLKRGKNIVEVSYNGNLEYNRLGFLRTYVLNYSLYPSKFWKTFGTINLEIPLGSDIKLEASNIGEPTIKNNVATWQIKSTITDTIELEFTKKISKFSELLLKIEPLGMALMALVLFFVLHLILLKNSYKKHNGKYKNTILYLGVLLVSVLFYVVYFLSYDLIDFSLGQRTSNHGYVILFVFTFPVLIIMYGILMLIINRQIKNKYSTPYKQGSNKT